MKNYDVTALGELPIDFTENGVSGQGNPLFEANPGGVPCNVLAMLSKLGHKTTFIAGKDDRDHRGGDTFGACCLHYVLKYGIDGFDERRCSRLPMPRRRSSRRAKARCA